MSATKTVITTVALYCVFTLISESTQAQGQGPGNRATLTQSVEPSFRIEPIVHRFTGRRGEILPFEFEITSLGKSMDLKIAPVNLRQEESGVILHDSEGKPSDAIKLITEDEFHLGPGEAKKITGEVTIPKAKTNYISFGILVKDRGQQPKFDNVEGDRVPTKAGIRFVTQYVLRVDIDTGNADPREFGKLRLEKGTILSQQGLPVVRTYLNNPTNFAYECQVRARIDSDSAGKPRPFLLGMPSRAEILDDGRYLVRIMPKSRLRLEAPVDFPIFSGKQTLNVGVTNGRRELVGAEFALSLSPDAFPALESKIAYVGEGIAVSPSQIELGTARGANRMLGMKFVNNSSVDQSVSLVAQGLTGGSIDGLKLIPEQFKIRAGKSKNVRVKVLSKSGETADSLGQIVALARPENGQPTQQTLPLIVRRSERQPPQVTMSNLELVQHDGRPAFQLRVKNEGSSFVPVSADLEIAAARGRAMRLLSGYGKWVLPGAEKTLLFTPDVQLPSGEYLLSLAVKTYDDLPATTKTLSIQLRSQSTETSSLPQPASRAR